ncbi:LysR family transcriptional regulator [Actinomadura darangshiensis]|uniref:LysR family transcriptional regulator n=1 Tax=Actinomadura darangshiensis TaxID=705336 RepID=A0A4R5B4K5_9ACTN|nr:LysR family transcriptional regulator [Actinomadura darangshiensis]TDD81158.1 LysR family transcriptional regulator [Actinomadura darangshiensis]
MERYEIETFLTLAKELNFTRTAERLLVSPGRVSQTIKKLERRLGGALFERSSHHVALTPVGRQLYAELQPAHQQMQRAIDNAAAAFVGISGALRVGFTTPWSGALIMRAAEAFNSRHPRCTVEPHAVTYNAAIATLQGEDVDLVVAALPIEDPAIIVGPLVFSDIRALAVPADHPLAARKTVSLEDLAVLPLITAAGIPPAWREAHFPRRTPQGHPIRHGAAAAGWQEILSLVGAGQGATVTTVCAGRYHGRPDVVYVPFDGAPLVDYALMWRGAGDTVGLRNFVRTVVEFAPHTAGRSVDRHSAPS